MSHVSNLLYDTIRIVAYLRHADHWHNNNATDVMPRWGTQASSKHCFFTGIHISNLLFVAYLRHADPWHNDEATDVIPRWGTQASSKHCLFTGIHISNLLFVAYLRHADPWHNDEATDVLPRWGKRTREKQQRFIDPSCLKSHVSHLLLSAETLRLTLRTERQKGESD